MVTPLAGVGPSGSTPDGTESRAYDINNSGQIAGSYAASNPGNAFFYLLTGTHAAHLAGGLMVLLYAGVISLLHKPLARQRSR